MAVLLQKGPFREKVDDLGHVRLPGVMRFGGVFAQRGARDEPGDAGQLARRHVRVELRGVEDVAHLVVGLHVVEPRQHVPEAWLEVALARWRARHRAVRAVRLVPRGDEVVPGDAVLCQVGHVGPCVPACRCARRPGCRGRTCNSSGVAVLACRRPTRHHVEMVGRAVRGDRLEHDLAGRTAWRRPVVDLAVGVVAHHVGRRAAGRQLGSTSPASHWCCFGLPPWPSADPMKPLRPPSA